MMDNEKVSALALEVTTIAYQLMEGEKIALQNREFVCNQFFVCYIGS
jgi:hypothetical protein